MEFLLYILNLIREGNPEGLSVLLILVIMLCLYIIVRLYTAKYITGMTNDSRFCIAVLIVVLFFVTLYRPHHNYEGLHSRESLQLRKEIEQLTARYKDAEETISNLSANYAIKTKENTQLQNKISELSSRPAAIILSGDKESAERIQQLTSENSRLTKNIEQLNAKYQDAMNENKRLSDEAAQLRQDNTSINNEVMSLENKSAEKIQLLTSENSQLTKNIEQLNAKYQYAVKENKRLSDESAENLLKYNAANETISQLTQETRQLNTRINNEVMSLHSKENKSAERIQQLASENSRLTKEIEQLNAKYQYAVKENKRLSDESAENLLKYNTANKTISQLTKNVEQLNVNYKNAIAATECFFYDGGSVNQYFEEAEKFLRKNAENGFSEAQFYLGYMLDPKHAKIKKAYKAMKQSTQEAKEMYSLAASSGHSMAQYYLANIYYERDQDYANAGKYYKLAADQGHEYAQYSLGYMYGCGYISGDIDRKEYGKNFDEGFQKGKIDSAKKGKKK